MQQILNGGPVARIHLETLPNEVLGQGPIVGSLCDAHIHLCLIQQVQSSGHNTKLQSSGVKGLISYQCEDQQSQGPNIKRVVGWMSWDFFHTIHICHAFEHG